MAYIITAILTALGCYVWHSLRVEELKCSRIALAGSIAEAITLLEKARDNLILQESKRLKAGEITAFIKRVRGA